MKIGWLVETISPLASAGGHSGGQASEQGRRTTLDSRQGPGGTRWYPPNNAAISSHAGADSFADVWLWVARGEHQGREGVGEESRAEGEQVTPGGLAFVVVVMNRLGVETIWRICSHEGEEFSIRRAGGCQHRRQHVCGQHQQA
ncbi:MAG UNVERIFIED_CONTAM: hypothetical protein LVR18_27310 [Planctomycetaceae bacterium]